MIETVIQPCWANRLHDGFSPPPPPALTAQMAIPPLRDNQPDSATSVLHSYTTVKRKDFTGTANTRLLLKISIFLVNVYDARKHNDIVAILIT